MRFNPLAPGIVTGCAAVVILATLGLAGQMLQGPEHAATAATKPQSGIAATSQAMVAEQEKVMMGMVQYGLTARWTVGFMVEGQKIFGSPTAYGGLRINSFFRVFPHDRLLNFTLYGEYEGLNGAALYKMEVAGFGGEDLTEPLAQARRTPVRTFEQRAIMYHDWGRVNLTFNFINETSLDSSENDFGYAWGVFRQPAYNAMETDHDMAGMAGMPKKEAPPMFSFQRLGCGLEMMGAIGNTHHFGFAWHRQQQYVGPVFSYAVSKHWTAHVEPTFGLSDVSDPFVLRMGIGYSIDHLLHRGSPTP